MTAPSTALSPREELKTVLARHMGAFTNLLPAGYDPSRLVTGALVAVGRNPKLLECKPQSVANALATIAQWGLDIGTTAHLSMYKGVCTPIADYKGYIELMVAAGARSVEAHEVREGDDFDFRYGTEPYLRHTPKGNPERPITHAYAIVTLRGGVQQFEVMEAAEIDAIRQAKSLNWKDGPLTGWYARKTVVRRVAKYVPKSVRLAALVGGDELPVADDGAPLSATQSAALEPKRVAGPKPIREAPYGGPTEEPGRTYDPDPEEGAQAGAEEFA